MMNKSGGMIIGCLAMVAVLFIVGVAFVLFGPDLSIPWVETTITLPDNSGQFDYRQKGTHFAMARLAYGTSSNECWIPWRPLDGPVNVYYYHDVANGNVVRLEDRFFEVLIDLQRAKSYLLVRPSETELFKGEIITSEDGSHCSKMNDGPWDVEVGNRKAENISTSVIVTNRGQYIGRIEVTGGKGADLPLIRFVPVKEDAEQIIKKNK